MASDSLGLPFLRRDTVRGRYYVAHRSLPRRRIHGEPGSEAFLKAYWRAREDLGIGDPNIMPKSPLPDMSGQTFGHLHVIERCAPLGKEGGVHYRCRCVCGTEIAVRASRIKDGRVLSCGCQRGWHNRTHGMSKRHALYSTWRTMRSRCNTPTDADYRLYGGRGIKICARWMYGENGRTAFECFVADMGPKPTPVHSIDRIDVDKDYEPGNCRWATPTMQRRNQRKGTLALNEAQVSEIKMRISLGEKNRALADVYRVKSQTIYRIRSGRSWKDVPAACRPSPSPTPADG